MKPQVALCADTESRRRPALIGLAGENLDAQGWLRVFSSAREARASLRTDAATDEVWVASCDDMDPINLAAALKRDRAERAVYLLAFQGTGSLRSRASAAGIDATLSHQAFAERYSLQKRRRGGNALGSSAPSFAPAPVSASASAAAPSPASASLPGRAGVASARQAFILSVVSGSGGAGKSTVAALAGMLAQGLGYETLLIDADLRFGDLPVLLGANDALAIDEVLAAPGRLSQLRPDGTYPALLAAPSRLEQAELAVSELPRLLFAVRPRFDVVIANTGSFWSDEHAILLEQSSKTLFLVDQRTSSLRACRHALDLCARCGIATSPFLFAVNRCAKGSLFTSIDVSCVLNGAHTVELLDGGRDVEELLGAGQPLDLLASRNDLCISLEAVLLDVLPDRPGAAPAKQARAAATEPERKRFRRNRSPRRRSAACL